MQILGHNFKPGESRPKPPANANNIFDNLIYKEFIISGITLVDV
ncbi:476_t:CDS:1, partial [Dentiscutata heterogama]